MNPSARQSLLASLTRGGIAVLVTLIAACGGSAPPAAAPSGGPPPSSASKADYDAPAREPPAGAAESAPAPATISLPPAPPPPPPVATEQPSVSAARRASRDELSQAVRDLEASLGDCASACRALGSMERATGHLCDMASDHDDRRTCEDAKTKVLGARDRIRATCGSCPDGPSLDRTAPIPSRR
jgi:hypothetical protein